MAKVGMIPRKYAEPADFKQALENHLKKHAAAMSVDVARLRQRWVFERFLARLTLHFGDRVIVKGGVALALRLAGARFTRDVDLRFSGSPDRLAVELSVAGKLRVDEDFLALTVEPDLNHPTIEAEGLKYGGQRFRVEAQLAGKVYGTRFGLDVVFGDAMAQPAEIVMGSDLFAFASIPPIQVLTYAREVHLAEKLHAFTALRLRENTRVKDLPDIALLALTAPFQSHAIRAAIQSAFEVRATHPAPSAVPSPPERWRIPYARMAQENGLRWASLDEITAAVRAFLDPVLRGEDGVWDPVSWAWRADRRDLPAP